MSPKAPSLTNGVPSYLRNAVWVVCLLLAFDFKGEQQGGAYQVAAYLVTILVLATSWLSLLGHPVRCPSRTMQVWLLIVCVYLVATLITAAIQRIEFSRYVVVVAPYVLLFCTFGFASGVSRRFGVAGLVRASFPAMQAMLLLSLIWSLVHGTTSGEATLVTARYHAVSPLTPFGVAIVASAVMRKRLSAFEIFLGVLLTGVLIIGQTRVYLLVLAIAVAATGYFYSRNCAAWLGKLLWFSVIGAVSIGVALAINHLLPSGMSSDLLALWAQRLFGSAQEQGFDLTTASRFAEYANQVQQLTSSLTNALLGMGFGAGYTYSGPYADIFIASQGIDAVPIDYWNGGHSLFFYTYFSSGLIFGSLFLGMIASAIAKGLRALVRSRRIEDPVMRHRVASIVVGFVCFIGTGLTAFPLGSRPIAMMLGLMLAVIGGLHSGLAKNESVTPGGLQS